MTRFGISRRALPLIALAVLLLSTRAIQASIFNVYDDAFITFRYARNLATGNGLVYNVGERVWGVTSPAFAVVCAALYRVGLPVADAAVALNVLLDVAVLLLTAGFLPARGRLWMTALFAACWTISPLAARICVGGTEMNLFLLCSVGAISLYSCGKTLPAAALAAGAYAVRPEALMLLAVMGSIELWQRRWRASSFALVAALALVAAMVVPIAYYEQWLPQSLAVKSLHVDESVRQVLTAMFGRDPLVIALVPAAVWGMVTTARNDLAGRLISAWVVVYLGVFIVVGPKVWSWYGEPVCYGVIVMGIRGASRLWRRVTIWQVPPFARRALPLPALLATLVWTALFVRMGPNDVTRFVYRPLASWCAANVRATDTVLAYDVGAVGFYCGGRVYDLAGLVTPGRVTFEPVETGYSALKSDFLFLNRVKSYGAEMMKDAYRRDFEPLKRFSKTGNTDLTIDPSLYPEAWVQDYIMFGRRRGR